METKLLTFYATERDGAVADFFRSQTLVRVESRDEGPGIRVGDRTLAATDIVSPVELRERLTAAGIAVPEYRVAENAPAIEAAFHANQPVTVRAGAESRFAQFAADAALPYHRLMAAQSDPRAVVESPVEGAGHWILGLVSQGEARVFGIVDLEWKDDVRRFPVVASAPTQLPAAHGVALEDLARGVVDAIDLHNGPFRIECVMSDYGPRVTEVDRGWFGGGLPVDLLQFAGIVDFWAEQCALLGIEAKTRALDPRSVVLRWLRSRSGIVEAVDGVDEVMNMPGVLMVQVFVQIGEKLGHVLEKHSRDRLGYLVVHGASVDKVKTLSNYAVESVVIRRRTVL